MSRHDPGVYLLQMRDHAREAVDLAKGHTRADLDRVRMLNLSLVRLCEVIGEAAVRVPEADRIQWPSIPWRAVVGLRNRLIHAYDQINFDTLWDIVQNDLPPLIAALEEILADSKRS